VTNLIGALGSIYNLLEIWLFKIRKRKQKNTHHRFNAVHNGVDDI